MFLTIKLIVQFKLTYDNICPDDICCLDNVYKLHCYKMSFINYN